MGFLVYANSSKHEFDDRTLAHLRIVIGTKLRRQEDFYINWTSEAGQGSGRHSLWITPSIPLGFHFTSSRAEKLNRVWLEALAHSANTPNGLVVMTEEEAQAYEASLPHVE